MVLLACIYLKTNQWANATNAADLVLKKDKRCNKARLVKAEALFNVCQFEHAMVHFNRGMVKKYDKKIFRCNMLFYLFSKHLEIVNRQKYSGWVFKNVKR